MVKVGNILEEYETKTAFYSLQALFKEPDSRQSSSLLLQDLGFNFQAQSNLGAHATLVVLLRTRPSKP